MGVVGKMVAGYPGNMENVVPPTAAELCVFYSGTCALCGAVLWFLANTPW